MNRLIIACILLTCLHNVLALTVGTHETPPFSMYADGENIGMSTEAVRTLLQKCGIEHYEIINYPLARGLSEMHEGRIDIYYPYVTESKVQSADYILIGPISRYKIGLFVRRDYSHEVSFNAMHNAMIGVERGGISAELLRKTDMHIEQATQADSCLRMVVAERVTACAIGTLPGQYSAAINNLTPKLRFADSGMYAEMYVVLSTRLPKELLEKIQATFNVLKQQNYFVQQQRDYEQKFQVFIKSLS